MTRLALRLASFVAADPHLPRALLVARASRCRILLVGGAVRDVALGRPAGDLDFIIDGPPRPFLGRLARMLGHRVVTFRKRGIVDHRIRAGAREWDFVERGRRSLRREILRRDFGLNAIAFDPAAGAIIDPAGGLRDLAIRRIRVLSGRAFRDDPVRMLRAVRLRAEIGGLALERRTSALIRREAALLDRASPERVKSEIDRMLTASRPSESIALLERLGLFARILPELDPLRGLGQNRYHHLDAFRHSLAALAAADDLGALARGLPTIVFASDPLEPFPDSPGGAGGHVPAGRPRPNEAPVTGQAAEAPRRATRSPRPSLDLIRARHLRWALLLHDTGKAETRTLGEDGETHFYLHERPSARIARDVLRRLRASRTEIAAVETLVRLHLRLSIPPSGDVTPRALRRIVREAGPLTPLLVLHSLADKIASRGPAHARVLARLRRAGRLLLETWRLEAERQRRQPRLVTGRDVMERLARGPGPLIGDILSRVEELQFSGELRTREDALAWLEREREALPSTGGPVRSAREPLPRT